MKRMKYAAIATALAISTLGLLLDDVTTFIGLARGFVELNPIYPYSLIVGPVFYVIFLAMLEAVRVKMIPREYNRYFVLFMCVVAAITFKGFVHNSFVLLGTSA